MTVHHWSDLTAGRIGALDPDRTVAVLPLGAVEQHGPHLPCGTDNAIGAGLLSAALARTDATVVAMPAMPYGVSVEHEAFPGSLSLEPRTMLDLLVDLGRSVRAADLRKLVIVSSHGGNNPIMATAAMELRRMDLFAVYTSWMRLGLPTGFVDEKEREIDIHAGRIETSLMLHFASDLALMEKSEDFPSRADGFRRRYRHLRAYGAVGFGWRTEDLSSSGAMGDAAAADAATGQAIAEHQAAAFATLLEEVATADISELLALKV